MPLIEDDTLQTNCRMHVTGDAHDKRCHVMHLLRHKPRDARHQRPVRVLREAKAPLRADAMLLTLDSFGDHASTYVQISQGGLELNNTAAPSSLGAVECCDLLLR
jgi:hypothetical protein